MAAAAAQAAPQPAAVLSDVAAVAAPSLPREEAPTMRVTVVSANDSEEAAASDEAQNSADNDTPTTTTASEEEMEFEKAPVIYGYMYKKSPGAFRLKAWDWRFFVVANMKIIWWRDRESCVPEISARGRTTTMDIESHSKKAESDPQCKGMINLSMTAAEVQEDAESEMVFYLAPRDGEWAAGATTDKHKDDKRVYVFDVTSSSHSRREWVQSIRKHIEQAQFEAHRRGQGRSIAQSEYWEDDTVDDEQAAAAARMMWKLEDKRRQQKKAQHH